MPFRLGVVGLGLGRAHAETILKYPADWTLAAVCEVLPERLNAFIQAHPEVRGFTDYEAFLADGDVDGVILPLPHDLHTPYAIQALQAGKHVIVEKPMARNAEECRMMNAAAAAAGKTLMVAQNWRYTPWVRAIKQVVDSGELGPIRVVRTEWAQNAKGDQRPGNWLLDGTRAGGGPVISLIVHNLDFLRYVFGEPRTVYAYCLQSDPELFNGAEAWGMAQFQFESGAIGHAFTSYVAFAPVDAGALWAYGDHGTICPAPGGGFQICSATRRPGKPGTEGGGYVPLPITDNTSLPTNHPMTNELLHFMECAQTGREPLSSGVDNIKTIHFIDAIYESARTGRVVTIS